MLNRAVWSPLCSSRLLLELIVATLLPPHGAVILLIHGTLVRRTGRRMICKGRLHDAVRSQKGPVVTSEGIHWVCLAVRVPGAVEWSALGIALLERAHAHAGHHAGMRLISRLVFNAQLYDPMPPQPSRKPGPNQARRRAN